MLCIVSVAIEWLIVIKKMGTYSISREYFGIVTSQPTDYVYALQIRSSSWTNL